MYQVNLLPWRIRRQRQRYNFWLRCFGAQLLAALLILAFTYGFLSAQQTQQRRALQGLTQQYAVLNGQIQQRQKMVAELAHQVAVETRRQQNRTHNLRYLALLQQLSLAIPEALWLTVFEENTKGISLRGFSGHYAAIAAFEQRLAALPLLQDSRLVDVTRRKDGVLAFTLTARWGQDG
ncbi:pilus assembly protein HofN [Serratia fonticola]|uniref:Pilus assembly protein HofN n=1 Tax=Serratia fonticola TaxID=47917 RepID=A0A542BGL0_SERFO|nr:PilN domain-containing protein [Serratia fonticola]TQI77714.1 pilus assembly protein HofN [Serratia fonticola]TQI95292.1 pilus assembly protein HofN [Serratia fonticola]TVZ69787.1 pilus assembly protein HofN [Serratia fonticola]